MIEVSPGEIWYATQYMGILVSGPDGEYRLDIGDNVKDEVVLSLLKDSRGNIWCATYPSGLFVYEAGNFKHVDSPYEVEPIAVELIEDSQQRIWLRGVVDGVWMFDKGIFKHFNISNNLVHDDVKSVFEDCYGSIWIGTQGGAIGCTRCCRRCCIA